MSVIELSIWAAMAGVLLTLVAVASLDVLMQRSASAARGWSFVALTGGSSVLMSGLPEALVPALQQWNLVLAKASLGPLSGALALSYLGIWSGAYLDDRLVARLARWGSGGLVVAAVLLACGAGAHADARSLLLAAAAVNMFSVAMAVLVAARSMSLGDPLARWVVLACLSLAVMVGGLYSKGLGKPGSNALWALTAVGTVGYFLIVIWLTLERNRQQRRLQRQASGGMETADGTGLARGVQLIRLVDDALWRSARMDRPCVVAAITVPNLHLGDEANWRDMEAHVLTTLAARIRRIVGFRNVLGLYHERCFVLAVSAVQDPRRASLAVEHLLLYLSSPVTITLRNQTHVFKPELGIGVVQVAPGQGGDDVIAIAGQAEQLALEAAASSARVVRADLQANPRTFSELAALTPAGATELPLQAAPAMG